MPTIPHHRWKCTSATASRAMVAGTSGPLAMRAAAVALGDGGCAADGAVVAALAQVVLSAGCWDSYAGILSFLYYDAASGTAHSLNAGYDTVRHERHPLSIRARGRHAGRRVLVPGFMAGIQAISERFCRLPFARLFAPAIAIAETGFALSSPLHALMTHRRRRLMRYPEGRAIFAGPDGQLPDPGAPFRQPLLAATLRGLSEHGADYMYRGPWARRFVEAVSALGGRLCQHDLECYRAAWSPPLRTSYREYELLAPAPPAAGGADLFQALHLLECADLRRHGPYWQSADALFWLIHISRAARFAPDLPQACRVSKAAAAPLWDEMRRVGGFDYLSRGRMRLQPAHSDATIAIDESGNIAALCHSINADAWGTGLFVGGVSVPDSAAFQQAEIAGVGPGRRLPDQLNPVLVRHGERAVLASACVGSALHETTIQCLVNVIDHGLPPAAAAEAPMFLTPLPTRLDRLMGWSRLTSLGSAIYHLLLWAAAMVGGPHGTLNPAQAVVDGAFDPAVLDGVRARGLDVQSVAPAALMGYWLGIAIGDEGGGPRLEGAAVNGPFGDALVIGD